MVESSSASVWIDDINGGWIGRLNTDRALRHQLQADFEQYIHEKQGSEFFPNMCYHVDLLATALRHPLDIVDLDDIPRMISRCIEYGLIESLQMLLEHEHTLLHMHDRYVQRQTPPEQKRHIVWLMEKTASNTLPSHLLDRHILLRRVGSAHCYLLAKENGYVDVAFENAITRIQQRYRRRRLLKSTTYHSPVVLSTSCTPPTPRGAFVGPWIAYEQHDRHWGYRQTWHFLQWNTKLAYTVLREILQGDWWGDCRYEAYLDVIEGPERRFVTEKYLTIK